MTMTTYPLTLLDGGLKAFDADPIAALEEWRDNLAEAKETARGQTCATIAIMTEFIRVVEADAQLRKRFCDHKFFSDDQRGSYKLGVMAGRFVLKVTSTKGAAYERARTYGNIAQHFCGVSIEPEAIAKELFDWGSVNRFHRDVVEAQALQLTAIAPTKTKAVGSQKGSAAKVVKAAPSPVDERRARAAKAAAVTDVIAKGSRPKPKRPKFNPKTMLAVEGPERMLASILGGDEGDTFVVKIRLGASGPGGWRTLVIKTLEQLPETAR